MSSQFSVQIDVKEEAETKPKANWQLECAVWMQFYADYLYSLTSLFLALLAGPEAQYPPCSQVLSLFNFLFLIFVFI